MPGDGPTAFVLGFQKCASTWLHQCLAGCPGVCVATTHMTHYYDIHHHRGVDWYLSNFPTRRPGDLLVDTTVSYALDDAALKRIAAEVCDPLLIFLLRDPIKRAFSHYWHEKQKGAIRYSFEEAFTNPDLYANWIRPGFYLRHLETTAALVPQGRRLVLLAEDVRKHPEEEFLKVRDFLRISCAPPAETLRSVVNVAANKAHVDPRLGSRIGRFFRKKTPRAIQQALPASIRDLLKDEYERGMKPDTASMLAEIYAGDVGGVRALLGRDLKEWSVP